MNLVSSTLANIDLQQELESKLLMIYRSRTLLICAREKHNERSV